MISDRFARVATAAVGAIVLSTLSIAAAIAPADAVQSDRSVVALAATTASQANG